MRHLWKIGAVSAAAALMTLTPTTAHARMFNGIEVKGAIEVEFDAAGGWAFFENPLGPEGDAANGGKFQVFQRNASIYWSPATNAHQVGGLIREKWGQLGWESGFLGYPISREIRVNNGSYNNFQGGSIYWSEKTGAHQIGGLILDKWRTVPLGFPKTDEFVCAGGGRGNHFEFGSIYWSPQSGTHVVKGKILEKWEELGFERSKYGFPTSDEYDVKGGGKAQQFQGGVLSTEDD